VTDLVLRVHNIVMGQLSSFAFSMLEFDLPAKDTLEFVNSMCDEHELSEDQQQMLVQQVNTAAANTVPAARASNSAVASEEAAAVCL
jgi:hypothetical protein